MGENTLWRVAARALLGRIRAAHDLATGRTNPTHRDLLDQIRAANNTNQLVTIQHNYTPNTPVGQHMGDFLGFGLRADAKQTPAHNIGDGLALLRDQIVLGDYTNRLAVLVDDR